MFELSPLKFRRSNITRNNILKIFCSFKKILCIEGIKFWTPFVAYCFLLLAPVLYQWKKIWESIKQKKNDCKISLNISSSILELYSLKFNVGHYTFLEKRYCGFPHNKWSIEWDQRSIKLIYYSNELLLQLL